MPKIQEYRSQVRTPGAIDYRRASAGDTSIAGGLSDIGEGLGRLGQSIQKVQEEKDNFEASKLVAQSQANWFQDLEKRQREAPPGAKDFTKTFSEDFDRWKETELEKAPTISTRRNIDLALQRVKSGLLDNAMNFEAQSYSQKQAQDLKVQFDRNENIVRSKPSVRDEILAAQDFLIDQTPFWNQQMKAKVKADQKQKVWDRSLDGTVATMESGSGFAAGMSFDQKLKAVDKTLAEIQDQSKGWVGNTSPEEYDRAVTRLEGLKKNLRERQQHLALLDFEDTMNQMEITGEDRGKYTRSWIEANIPDAEQAAKMIKRQETARAISEQVSWVKGAPDTEIVTKIQAMQSSLGKSTNPGRDIGATQGAIRAFQRRAEAWKEDQAGYTMSVSPTVKNSYDAFIQNLSPDTAQNYVDAATAEQRRLSPGSTPSLLPQSRIQEFEATLAQIGVEEGGANKALGLFQNEQRTWGKNWPLVVKDLKASKAINDSQYVAASMLDNPRARYLAEELMRSSMVKDDQLSKQIEGTGMQAAASKAVQGALDPLRQTLSAQTDGPEIMAAYQNAITKLVLFRGAQTGEDASGQAGDLARKIVLDSYEFKDSYRIPKRPNLNVREIESGVEKATEAVESMDLVMPADLSELRDEDAKRRFKRNLTSTGRWVTLGDESGIYLVDEVGHVVNQVKNGKESRVEFKWEDLQTMGVGVPLKNPYRGFTD